MKYEKQAVRQYCVTWHRMISVYHWHNGRNNIFIGTFAWNNVWIKWCLIFSNCSGEPLKETVKLEDGRIGERPEIVYHVIHTILLGCLVMYLEG